MRKILLGFLLAFTVGIYADTVFRADAPSYAWASLPAASGIAVGERVWVTDVGGYNGTTYGGSEWCSNGTRWLPCSGSRILLASFNADQTIANDTTETAVGATLPLPAGLLGANGAVYFQQEAYEITNSANLKTARIRLGTSATCSSNTQLLSESRSSHTGYHVTASWHNNGAENAQSYTNVAISGSYDNYGAIVRGTAAIDTSALSYTCFSWTHQNGAESLTNARLSIWADIAG